MFFKAAVVYTFPDEPTASQPLHQRQVLSAPLATKAPVFALVESVLPSPDNVLNAADI